MKDKFKSLRADLDAIVDKELAYQQIKQKIWPLANSKKPTGYLEFGDDENVDKKKAKENREKTMQMNHYVKFYLALIK